MASKYLLAFCFSFVVKHVEPANLTTNVSSPTAQPVSSPSWEDIICVEPYLSKTKYDSTIETQAYGDLSCYLYCDDDATEYYFDSDVQSSINTTVLILSIFGALLSFALCTNICVAHFHEEANPNPRNSNSPQNKNKREKSRTNTNSGDRDGHHGGGRAGAASTATNNGVNTDNSPKSPKSPRSHSPRNTLKRTMTLTNQFKDGFKDRPFTYDVPFCINVGYMLVMIVMLFPYIFGRKAVTCNIGESTMTTKNPTSGNGLCTLASVCLLFAIHIIGLYQAALAASLFVRLRNPTKGQFMDRWKVHTILWIIIIVVVIIVIALDVISAEFVLGICTSGLTNRTSLLWLNVVPIAVYCILGTGFLIGAILLLRSHLKYTQNVSKNKQHNAKMRRFFIRFITYGIVSTLGEIVYWITMLVFYVNLDQYKESVTTWIFCKISNELYSLTNECTHDGAPDPILYTLLPIAAFSITLAGLILSCTDDNFGFWKHICENGAASASQSMRRMTSLGRHDSTANLSEHDSMAEKTEHYRVSNTKSKTNSSKTGTTTMTTTTTTTTTATANTMTNTNGDSGSNKNMVPEIEINDNTDYNTQVPNGSPGVNGIESPTNQDSPMQLELINNGMENDNINDSNERNKKLTMTDTEDTLPANNNRTALEMIPTQSGYNSDSGPTNEVNADIVDK